MYYLQLIIDGIKSTSKYLMMDYCQWIWNSM